MKKEPCYACKTQPRKKTYIVCEACLNHALKPKVEKQESIIEFARRLAKELKK